MHEFSLIDIPAIQIEYDAPTMQPHCTLIKTPGRVGYSNHVHGYSTFDSKAYTPGSRNYQPLHCTLRYAHFPIVATSSQTIHSDYQIHHVTQECF